MLPGFVWWLILDRGTRRGSLPGGHWNFWGSETSDLINSPPAVNSWIELTNSFLPSCCLGTVVDSTPHCYRLCLPYSALLLMWTTSAGLKSTVGMLTNAALLQLCSVMRTEVAWCASLLSSQSNSPCLKWLHQADEGHRKLLKRLIKLCCPNSSGLGWFWGWQCRPPRAGVHMNWSLWQVYS